MAGMFHDATYYLGLSGLMKYNLTTANVEDTSAVAFNQDIGGWNTAEVLSMQDMFDGAKAFNQDIGSWNTAALHNTDGMFGAEVITCYKTSSAGTVPTSSGRVCPRMQMDNFCVQQPERHFVAMLCNEAPWPPFSEGHHAFGLPDKAGDCKCTLAGGHTYSRRQCMLKAVALDGAWDILVDADSPLWPGAYDVYRRRRRGV